jgi:methanethiol S-methyltransferase
VKRWLYFTYGIVCYFLFLGTFAYMAGFVGNFLVPKSIDTPSALPLAEAVMIDLVLVGLFAVQHSVMARPAFKAWWTRVVPQPIERSTYVLFSCVVVIVMMWLWQGINTNLWNVQSAFMRNVLWVLFVVGWLSIPVVSLAINHFDLFGLRQVWFSLKGENYHSLDFRVPLFYKVVRHPLYVGWAVAFWVTPTMSWGHLLFAGSLTVYIVCAALSEETDLIAHFGEQYREYRRRVPMFVPRLRKSATMDATVEISHSQSV